jgi:hypothetical protein
MATLKTTYADGLQPGHDIFCTPDNTSFYATKPYLELDSAQQVIRLVKVWPDTGSGLIECTLLKETPLLDSKGHYTALSYCAGDVNDTDTILLNGTRFNVFANLRYALEEVRRFWSKTYDDRECLVWVDQISINQSDIRERSHQVRFMREIYQYAEQVLVCLSTKNINPGAMDWLLRLAEDVPFGSDISDGNEEEFREDRWHWYRLRRHMWASILDEKFVTGWLAFYDLVDAPWWNRSWIFQEFIVASKVHFMYCGEYAAWEALFPIWRSICSLNRPLMDLTHFLIFNPDFRLGGPEDLNLCRIIERVERGKSQAAVDTLRFVIDSKASWSGMMDLKRLLAHSRYCNTTDPRDKVFAYIGLADPAYGILPDYSHSTARVLTDTTVKIIQVEDSLDILYYAAASLPRQDTLLPSWVIDCACAELSNETRNGHYATELRYKYTGLARQKANASFHTLETSEGCLLSLQVRGAFIDKLTAKEILVFDGAGQYAPSACFISPKGFNLSCSTLIRPDDEMWIIDGCGIPLILRTQHEYGYSLVSAATILMKGDHKSNQDIYIRLLQLAKIQHGGWQNISII